jgi:hypothetical protein
LNLHMVANPVKQILQRFSKQNAWDTRHIQSLCPETA